MNPCDLQLGPTYESGDRLHLRLRVPACAVWVLFGFFVRGFRATLESSPVPPELMWSDYGAIPKNVRINEYTLSARAVSV